MLVFYTLPSAALAGTVTAGATAQYLCLWGGVNGLCFVSVLLQVPVLQSLPPLVSCVGGEGLCWDVKHTNGLGC